ncbi:uncharacterized protein LOC106014120, partial [Aplysia californica]|uniref:Uncharacterized protein LOC106014120 n=1 Tax=Aplysia californica TaxID=6500 RepID=A0ABM1AFG2_APLCA
HVFSDKPWGTSQFNGLLQSSDVITSHLSCVRELTGAELPDVYHKPLGGSVLVDLRHVTGCEARDFDDPPYPIANNTVALARSLITKIFGTFWERIFNSILGNIKEAAPLSSCLQFAGRQISGRCTNHVFSDKPWGTSQFNGLLQSSDVITSHLSCVRELTGAELPDVYHKPLGGSVLVDLRHVTGCEARDFDDPPYPIANNTVALARGNCSVLEKAQIVHERLGAALLVVDYMGHPWTNTTYGHDLANFSLFHNTSIPVALIQGRQFAEVRELTDPVTVNLLSRGGPRFGLSLTLLLFLNLFVILIAGLWSGVKDSNKVTLGLKPVVAIHKCLSDRPEERFIHRLDRLALGKVGVVAVM